MKKKKKTGHDDSADLRKRAEEALRESEKKFRGIFENVLDVYYETAIDGTILEVSPSIEIVSKGQYHRDDLIGKSMNDFYSDPGKRQTLLEALQERGNVVDYEIKLKNRDGLVIPCSISSKIRFDAQGRPEKILGTIRDISERKRVEDALRASEGRYRQLFDAESDAIFLIDNETGRILEANNAASALYGYSREELLTKKNTDLSSEPEETQQVTRGTPAISEQVITIPLRLHRKKDGTVFPVEITGRFFTWQGRSVHIAAIRDITERKRAEETLRKSEEKYRGLTENINLGIYRNTVGPEGKFIEANPSIIGMFGYKSKEEFLAINVSDLYQNPEDRNNFNDKMLKEGVVRGEELWLKKKDGSLFVGSVSAVAVKDEQGHVKYYDGIIDDITERKRAKEALLESHERYSQLANSIADIFFAFDKDLKYTYWNAASEKLMKISAEEAIGKSLYDLFPDTPQTRIAEKKYREVLKTGLSQTFVNEYKIGGKDYYFEISVYPSKYGISVFSKDITERKQAEETLRESEERFRRLSEATFEGILIHEEGKIIDTNRLFATMFGYDVSEVIGGNALDFATLGLGDVALRHMRTESSEAYEGVAIRKDGSTFPVEVQAENILYKGRTARVTAIRDITERKQAEEALRESEEKYRTLVEKANEAIVIVQDGVFVFTNRRTSDLVGVPAGDLEGKPFIDFVWPEDRELLIANYRKRIAGETVRDAYDCRIIGAGGRLTWIFLSAAVIRWKGKPATLNLLTDITERKQAEEEVRRKAKELQEKNDELTRFTHAVAHDLRSPLVTIQTFQGHLERDIRSRDAARVEEDLGFIRNAADKMGRLLDDIRRLSRVGHITNPSEEAPLQAIVKEALDLVAGRITGRGVKVQVTEEPVVLYGDRTRLVEVFLNLVDNAVKFMGDEPAPRVEIGVEQTGEELVLHVRDNGIGIDPQVQPLLFSLFHKLDPKMEGEGIGLALVRRIAELHGGRIWVESEGLGKGTTFRFTLAKTRRRRAEEEKP
jgi:PAS domain S-box-containing protein